MFYILQMIDRFANPDRSELKGEKKAQIFNMKNVTWDIIKFQDIEKGFMLTNLKI